MKTTGIVRRLDELGRIVIPREYRRLYGINIGDPLEIVAMENGDIVISKVSSLADLTAIGKSACDGLAVEYGLTAAVGDLSEIKVASGGGKSTVMGKELTPEVAHQIKERRSGIQSGVNYGFAYMAYAPVFGSDVFGGLFLFGGIPIDESKLSSLKITGKIIGDSLQKF